MKQPANVPRLTAVALFTLGHSLVMGMGLACLLRLLGMAMAMSLDSSVVEEYPRFLPFCLLLGLGALVGLCLLTLFNLRTAKRVGYTKVTWSIQVALVLLLALPSARMWTELLSFLQFVF